MIVAALLALASPQDVRFAPAQLALTGPLERVELDCGARGRVELRGRLLPGERRTLRVPLPGRPLDDAPPRIDAVGGTVRFEGYLDPPPPVPPDLARRTRPPVVGAAPLADSVAALLVVVGAVAVLAARRRPVVAGVIGVVAAGLVAAAQLREPPAAAQRVRVLEGNGAGWVLVEGAADVLPVDPEVDLAVEVEPARAGLTYAGDLQGSWTVRGAALWRRAPLEPGGRRVDGRMNLWGALDQVWLRSAAGVWTERDAWALGAPLPEAHVVGQPPGWLAAGLPQGRGILVARLAAGTWAGEDGPGGVPEVVWLRLVGFDFVGGR